MDGLIAINNLNMSDQTKFLVGYCPCCGAQSQITDERNRPIGGLIGSKLAWICLCDKDDKVFTRIGTVCLCPKCGPSNDECQKMIDTLVRTEGSGLNGDDMELSSMHHARIEVIKEYGA